MAEKERKLTLRQRKFIKNYMETGNGTESARLAGYKGKDNVLGAIATRLLKNVKISAVLEKLKEKAGLTDEYLLQKHKELLEAQKLHSCNIFVKKDKAGKYVINKNSDDFIEVPDSNVQLGALKLAFQLNGKLKDRETDPSGAGTNIIIVRPDSKETTKVRKREDIHELKGVNRVGDTLQIDG